MRIVVDLTALSYHITGIERYAMCVTEKMLEQDQENEYLLLFKDEVHPVFELKIDDKRIKAIILKGKSKLLFYQLCLPFNLYKIKADKYLFFAFTSPILFKRKGIINTIHDMGAWDVGETMKMLQKIYFQYTYRISAKASEKIISVSEFSKGRIIDLLNVDSQKIVVIPSAVYEGVTKNYGKKIDEIKEKYDLPEKYIMTLSTLEPRKNMAMLLEAYVAVQDSVPYDLVLVGRKGWKMDDVISQYNSMNRIHITGFVDDEDISVIYKNAMCFVFPSLYEGFGLPPVEALALGTPVLSSNAASLPEVLRKQAAYFENRNRKDLINKLVNLEKNLNSMPNTLDDFQLRNFTFEASANKVLKLIHS